MSIRGHNTWYVPCGPILSTYFEYLNLDTIYHILLEVETVMNIDHPLPPRDRRIERLLLGVSRV